MTENTTVGEIDGCIVCCRIFNILTVYSPTGKLVDCTVISPVGQIVPDHRKPLAACSSHTTDEIDVAYKKWQSSKNKNFEDEQENQ